MVFMSAQLPCARPKRPKAAQGIRNWLALCALLVAVSPGTHALALDASTEQANVEQWRAKRVASLKSDTGWLTLAGLFWLKPGENTFGRAPSNAIVLDNPSLTDAAGSFIFNDHTVRFVAKPGSGVTHAGQPVTTLELTSDAAGPEPTVLESGSLRFFIIERSGNFGVRVRDLNNPHRSHFLGLEYFPISADWAFEARFEPYEPHKHIPIVNILGMEEQMDSPGAVVFTREGHEYRLDTVLESPDDPDLFVMFADATSGHETYGAGRFLRVPFPKDGHTLVDFNKAYNPPCSFNDFATCPLPPYQNRLTTLRVAAGEKKYAGGH
jgi:uncharacterized protein (DUF1684 family)